VAEQQRNQEALLEQFRALKITFRSNSTPPGAFSMGPLQCIEFNPNSKFHVSKGIKHQSDQWWSRLKFDYELGSTVVESDIFPIFGAYLDLHPRTSTGLAAYARTIVNVYIPTKVMTTLVGAVRAKTGHDIVAGKELIDDLQGLTSFLAAITPDSSDLEVTCYIETQKVNTETNEATVTGLTRRKFTLPDMFAMAQQSPPSRILGGVAFIHLSANHSCVPGTFSAQGNLPKECPVEIKIKLTGFHCLGMSGKSVVAISYKKRAAVTL
jgi:hypothetical protein